MARSKTRAGSGKSRTSLPSVADRLRRDTVIDTVAATLPDAPTLPVAPTRDEVAAAVTASLPAVTASLPTAGDVVALGGLPAAASLGALPTAPTLPDLPALPPRPAVPELPTAPTLPDLPAVPLVGDLSGVPRSLTAAVAPPVPASLAAPTSPVSTVLQVPAGRARDHLGRSAGSLVERFRDSLPGRAENPPPTDGGAPLPEVEFSFELAGDVASWRLRAVQLREELATCYEAVVDLVADDPEASPDPMMGADVVVTMQRASVMRRLCGLVRRVEDLGTTAGRRLARVYVVPALWTLSLRSNHRVYQDLTAVEVVRAVLKDAGLYGTTLSDELQRTYAKREYCVQSHESDLAFVTRLLEEEGVTWYFSHDGDTETLVLLDEPSAFRPCTTMDDDPVPVAGPDGETLRVESVRRFDWSDEMRSTGVTVRDFDFTRPAAVQDMTRATPRRGVGAREVYEYPGRFTLGEYHDDTRAYTKHDGARRAETRHEELQTRRRTGTGESVVTGFTPGFTFKLTGHGRADLDDRVYIVTRVLHDGFARETLSHDVAADGARPRYANRFECVPLGDTFRPATRAPRPYAHPQTATVTGPAGEEIWVDPHGRIKVQFHWDRVGARDERSSCWIRVAQPWAGAGFGSLFTPRIGAEVVVSFLDGNPDRPIVTGSVYNGENPPPLRLPDEKTRSTLRTKSTPHGDGSNELRFEDRAHAEQVYLHAQRDLDEVVERNHTTQVGGSQSNTVGGNQTETIGHDQTRHVRRHRDTTIDANDTQHIGGHQSVVVDGVGDAPTKGPAVRGATLQVTGQYDVTVSERIKLQVQDSTVVIDGRTITLDAPDAIVLRVGSTQVTLTAFAASVVSDAISLSASGGKSLLALNGEGADLHGAQQVRVHKDDAHLIVTDDVVLSGAQVVVHAAGDVTVEGRTAHLEGTDAAVLGGGGASTTYGGGVVQQNG